MKRIVQVFLMLISAASVAGQGSIFFPGPTEGNSSTMDPFTSSSFRFQQVYAASGFGDTPVQISQISFRIDGASMSDVTMFFGGTTLTLSTTPVGPDGLSTDFSFNIGSNPVTVRTGAGSFGGSPPPSGSTAMFASTFSFTTPYLYNPAQGNLLIDFRGRSGQLFLAGAMDGQRTFGDSVSWVFATSELSPSGTADTFGLVTRLTVNAVPEPSTYALMLLGLGAVVFVAHVFRKPPNTNSTSAKH